MRNNQKTKINIMKINKMKTKIKNYTEDIMRNGYNVKKRCDVSILWKKQSEKRRKKYRVSETFSNIFYAVELKKDVFQN